MKSFLNDLIKKSIDTIYMFETFSSELMKLNFKSQMTLECKPLLMG
jgi:hypothetical protein